MVGHQAIGQEPHRAALLSLVKQPQEGGVVGLLVKHPLPGVPSIEDVVAIPYGSDATRPGHGAQSIA